MLAPLKDRSILECDPGDPQTDLSDLTPDDRQYLLRLEADNEALRSALRHARQSQRRSAQLAARRIIAQVNEINRLGEINTGQRQRLAEFESGQAIIELGCKLVQLSENNHHLCTAAQRVWFLEKTLGAAHAECARLAGERDRLMQQTRAAANGD